MVALSQNTRVRYIESLGRLGATAPERPFLFFGNFPNSRLRGFPDGLLGGPNDNRTRLTFAFRAGLIGCCAVDVQSPDDSQFRPPPFAPAAIPRLSFPNPLCFQPATLCALSAFPDRLLAETSSAERLRRVASHRHRDTPECRHCSAFGGI